MNFLSRLFNFHQSSYFKKLQEKVNKINELEQDLKSLSNEQIKEKFLFLQSEVLDKKLSLDEALFLSFALTREAAKRTIQQRHFDVQLIGGIALHEGKIVEMKTGEGKTLVATLPAVLNGISKKGVHIVTVNDYLARRDAVWMGQIYDFLGLSVGCVTQEEAYIYDPKYKNNSHDDKLTAIFNTSYELLRPVTKKEAYSADITYGTNNAFGFDYLRDNLARDFNDIAQRPYNYVIIDEVDSILIDEARTPLIISTPDKEAAIMYKKFASIIPLLKKEIDYKVDEKFRAVTLTEEGIRKVEELLNDKGIYQRGDIEKIFHLEQSLKAFTLFHKDKDYIVKNGQVIIIDEFTGRLMPDRRYSEGIHQAIEAKEGVLIKEESKTLATITFQNLFRKYPKIAGMTGTAITSAEEFFKVYQLETVAIPPNKPMIRKDHPDRVYKTMLGKFKAVVEEIKERNKVGQPVLVGTISIEKNELLSAMLKKEGIAHNILNAKNHEKEAEIIAQAGRLKAVTVATNMAGRGVDIILGGNPPNLEQADKVRQLGGLYVIGTERHEARRIDNQLRGRSGRQGDPGESRFFISLEDDLLRVFGPDRLKRLMDTLKIPDDQPIESKFVTSAIESAQSKIEGFNFDIRKYVLEYDEVLNKQREAVYRERKKILEKFAKNQSLLEDVFEMLNSEIKNILSFYNSEQIELDYDNMINEINAVFGLNYDFAQVKEKLAKQIDLAVFTEIIFNEIKELFLKKFESIDKNILEDIIKNLYLSTIDAFWMEHLDFMEHLKEGVRLRAYGQQDPLVEYKREGAKMFSELNRNIKQHFIKTIFKIQFSSSLVMQKKLNQMTMGFDQSFIKERNPKLKVDNLSVNSQYRNVGRNDPCFCGSGKKYKKCHGALR